MVAAPEGDGYTVWTSTQTPHIVRYELARAAGMPESALRVVAPDVGGGFGSKVCAYGEDLVLLLASRRSAQPVTWTATRSEDLATTAHGRVVVAGRDPGGRLGREAARPRRHAGRRHRRLRQPGRPRLGARRCRDVPRHLPAGRVRDQGHERVHQPRAGGRLPRGRAARGARMRSSGWWTSWPPSSASTRSTYAAAAGPPTSRTPSAGGVTYDVGDYDAATDRALELLDYPGLREEQARRRASADTVAARHRGVDVHRGVRQRVEVLQAGAGDRLGAAARRRRCRGRRGHHGVRDRPHHLVEPAGLGRAGGAVHRRARGAGRHSHLAGRLRQLRLAVADRGRYGDPRGQRSAPGPRRPSWPPRCWRRTPATLELVEGVFRVKGTPTTGVIDRRGGAEVLRRPARRLRARARVGVREQPRHAFLPGRHPLAAVEVDTETGMVRVRRFVAVDDVRRRGEPDDRRRQARRPREERRRRSTRRWPTTTTANSVTPGFSELTIAAAPDLPAFVTDRTCTPSITQPARGQGGRRDGRDRLDPRGGQRRARRAAPPRGARPWTCRAPRSGSGGRWLPRDQGRAASGTPGPTVVCTESSPSA